MKEELENLKTCQLIQTFYILVNNVILFFSIKRKQRVKTKTL